MYSMKIAALLLVGMAMAAMSVGALANGEDCNIKEVVGQTWLATGTVTDVDGQTFYMQGKDNNSYKIDTHKAEIMIGEVKVEHYLLKAGDTVRVYGTVGDGCKINASRVRIFTAEELSSGVLPEGAGPAKEVKIIIEKDTEPGCAPCGNQWRGRGLITYIDYLAKRLKVQTPAGHYTIDIGNVPLIYGATIIGLAQLNQGDAVKISGNIVGVNEVQAQTIRVTRSRSEAENSLPLTPASVAGLIEQVDYPSFTFRMRTENSELVISVDEDTVIQRQLTRISMLDLKPGMRVKMTGYGSPGTGYAAQHIQIISAP
ncbi:DUF5666 domain-containing protein [bacterium]|nr:DUF5666 domain-containing protein [bacterium]